MTMHKINRVALVFLIVFCMALGLTGCQFKGNVIGLSDYYYADSEKYLVGGSELSESVENIEIDWISGSVTVMSHNLDTVSFSEKSDSELIENTKLHYWLDDMTLRIRFCGCGKQNFSEMEKELIILVPNVLILSNLKINTLSANVKLSDCAVTQSVKINTISGRTEANLIRPLNEFYGRSTSGVFEVSAPTVSGFDVGTVSGEVSLSVQKEPNRLNVDTTSGNINLNLPENASFTLSYDTTSGDLISDLFYSKSENKYIFGDENKIYEIITVSGDIRITIFV